MPKAARASTCRSLRTAEWWTAKGSCSMRRMNDRRSTIQASILTAWPKPEADHFGNDRSAEALKRRVARARLGHGPGAPTAGPPHALALSHGSPAPAVSNQALVLERPGQRGHGRPLNTHHLGHKILSKVEHV